MLKKPALYLTTALALGCDSTERTEEIINYDTQGNITMALRDIYNDNGRKISSELDKDGDGRTDQVERLQYDAEGKPKGIWTVRYDGQGLPTSVSYDREGDGQPDYMELYAYDRDQRLEALAIDRDGDGYPEAVRIKSLEDAIQKKLKQFYLDDTGRF